MANENQIILALDLAHLSPADQLSALKKILADSYVQSGFVLVHAGRAARLEH